jgi:hypothetical protein
MNLKTEGEGSGGRGRKESDGEEGEVRGRKESDEKGEEVRGGRRAVKTHCLFQKLQTRPIHLRAGDSRPGD